MTDTTAPRIYPTLRYDDAQKAIDFLVDAFGFVRHEVHEGDDGTINHAQLAYDTGIVMLSSRRGDNDLFEAKRMAIYVAVDDPDAHHARAVAAGAEIIMELTDQPYGSREYAAVDPEGNAWSFGTYRPAVS
jgi:uncharacterized glyoxalase superfamily protein PhnB